MKKPQEKNYLIIDLLKFKSFKFIIYLRRNLFYIKDYRSLKKQMCDNTDFEFGRFHPVLSERFKPSGVMKGHYFYQDLLIARKIYKNNPLKHVDIGSRIDGFVAHVAVFREIEIFDIRPQENPVENIIFKQADLMKLPDNMKMYCDSVSSLHAIEHFGLGRYGDPIDIEGHLKAITNIHLMLKPKGKFYFSVPIGKQRIEFNAHRVFSIEYLLKIFSNRFNIDNFSYVDDKGCLFQNVSLTKRSIETDFGCSYGCGIFELTKI